MGSPQQPRTLQPLIHHPRVAHALRKGTLPQHPQLGHRSHRQKQERQGRAGGRAPETHVGLRQNALHPGGQHRRAGLRQAGHRPVQTRRRRDARPAEHLPRHAAPHQRGLRPRVGRGRGHVLPPGSRPGRFPDLRLRPGQKRRGARRLHLRPRHQPFFRHGARRERPASSR